MRVIVDYGVNNVSSIVNMLRKAGFDSRVATSPEELDRASFVILPGIGSYDSGVQNLKNRGFFEPLQKFAKERRGRVLGICLGMQLLGHSSEEGSLEGLGIIPGRVRRIPPSPGLKVPHMGWNFIHATETGQEMFPETEPSRFYFVHSYHFVCDDASHVTAEMEFGTRLTAAVCKDNVYGVQFHPEKSHRFGLDFFCRVLNLGEIRA